MEKYVFADGREFPFIASRQNPRVTRTAKLGDKKHREMCGRFLCEGLKLTLDAARYGRLSEIYLRESDAPKYADTVGSLGALGCEVFVLSDAAFDKITTEKAPQGIIAVAECEKCGSEVPEDGSILFLDSVRDPGNLGTILRSACAFGRVSVALHSCADIYNPKTVRAAMGAIFKASLIAADDAVAFLGRCKAQGRRILGAALTLDSLTLGGYDTRSDDVVVVGNEGHGISREILDCCDGCVFIPMNANTESLNASVAASVILWEYARGNK